MRHISPLCWLDSHQNSILQCIAHHRIWRRTRIKKTQEFMLLLYAKWKPNKNNPTYHNRDYQKPRVRDSSDDEAEGFC